jgi:hypothetical protein
MSLYYISLTLTHAWSLVCQACLLTLSITGQQRGCDINVSQYIYIYQAWFHIIQLYNSAKMYICSLTFLLFVTVARSSFIVTTKVTPSYWRATFSSPPLNLENTAFFEDFYALVDRIANDSDVKVIVFDSVCINGPCILTVISPDLC